jgi:PKHD-type hydroxylase
MAWLLKTDEIDHWAYWDDAFSPQECEIIKNIAAKKIKERATISGDEASPGRIDTSIRNNSVAWLDEEDQITFVYERLTGIVNSLNDKYFKFHLYGFCEKIQFTEYKAPGEFYKEHIDKMYGGAIRKLSVIVQLTDPEEYEGCDLNLNVGSINTMKKTQGSVIVFPSYVLHQVTPITKGTRHSLVAWLAGDPFK